MNYYVITGVYLESRELINLKAYKTSADFSLFLPSQEFSRKELIDLIRQGDIFYKWYRNGRRVPIHLKFIVNLGIDQFVQNPRQIA